MAGIHIHDTMVQLWFAHGSPDDDGSLQLLRSVLGRMRRRGWTLAREGKFPDFDDLDRRHWVGRLGDLQMYAECFPMGMRVCFFQDINHENQNGGRYDFNKFSRLPRPMRLRCAVEMAAVVRKLLDRGFTLTRHEQGFDVEHVAWSVLRIAENRPTDVLNAFNHSWNSEHDWARGGRFERDERGWPAVSAYDPYGHNKDRDDVPLRNGETRYFRGYNGRLYRGTIFCNMNQMWLVGTGVGRRNLNQRELFHCERPDLEPRRLMRNQPKRLRGLLDEAVKAEDFERVATLGRVLARAA